MCESVKITLPSKPEYVAIARLTASVLANQCGFDIEDIDDIKVAVGEACNNAVLHTGNNSSSYDIVYTITNTEFKIKVSDCGSGFNITNYHEPDLEKPSVGGLGIFIMKSLMDHVEISSIPEEGTAITLIKNIV